MKIIRLVGSVWILLPCVQHLARPRSRGTGMQFPPACKTPLKIVLEKSCWWSLPAWTWAQLMKVSENGYEQGFESWGIAEKCNLSEGRISHYRTNFVLKDRHVLTPRTTASVKSIFFHCLLLQVSHNQFSTSVHPAPSIKLWECGPEWDILVHKLPSPTTS